MHPLSNSSSESMDAVHQSLVVNNDITKARKYLGWEPKVPLEQGIVKAADYFASLDLGRFRKPTKHTAHLNTEQLESSSKKQKTK